MSGRLCHRRRRRSPRWGFGEGQDRLTVLGGIGGDGSGGDLAGKLIAMSEQLKAATGVDMVQAVRERLVGKPVPPVRVGT